MITHLAWFSRLGGVNGAVVHRLPDVGHNALDDEELADALLAQLAPGSQRSVQPP